MEALVDGPEPDEFADFGSALLPGGRAFRPGGLFVADGGSECPEGRCCAVGSAFPGVPSCSFFVPSGRLLGAWSGTQATETRHSRRSETVLRVAAVPWGLLSLGFPRVPFLFLLGVYWGPGVERRPPKRGIRAGQRLS